MTIRQVTAAVDLRPDLFLLGISEGDQQRHPTALSYPKKFASSLKDDWAAMFTDDFRSVVLSIKDPIDAWGLVLTDFLTRCQALKKEPYDTAPNTAINDSLVSLMLHHRNTLGKAIDRLGVIKSFTLRNIERHVIRTSSGFKVHVTMDMRPRKGQKFTHKGTLINTLSSSAGMFSLRGGVFTRHVNAAVEIRFNLEVNPWRFEYIITSHSHPEFAVKNKAVTRHQYERFVIDSLWLPAVRRFQFRTNSMKYSLA